MPSATRQWGRIAVAKATNAQNALLKPRNLITETPRSDATSVKDARRFTAVRQARRKRRAEENRRNCREPYRAGVRINYFIQSARANGERQAPQEPRSSQAPQASRERLPR